MTDIIKLLPDTLANQIAAGEVIQRPASAVKEMLENAIDAKATEIHLIIKDAGKELIQIIDNGQGMSETDARMSFERHATSKIKSIDDLFSVRTMGFRGEALASIAAVARVELKTKQSGDETGSFIQIENGQVSKQEVCQTPVGTSISIKNLFYNVPARRNFLKSNTTEMRHIVEEFTRVAMAFPEVGFELSNNENTLFKVEKGNLKQRILALLGNSMNNKLVPVLEETAYLKISGFCGTPDAASKTRGQQFFFVNNRFIKSAYLNHAVNQAFRDLLPKDEFPFFVLFIDVDPIRIDINVHPTKQEIKFEEEKIIYAFVNSALKHALGKYSIIPSIDFNVDAEIENLSALSTTMNAERLHQTKNDFLFQSFTQKGKAHFLEKTNQGQQWKELYKIQETLESEITHTHKEVDYFQISNTYIGFNQGDKIYLVHQQNAHERILFEKLSRAKEEPISVQKCLMPQTWELNASDAIVVNELLEEFLVLGYVIEAFGGNTFVIQGVPNDVRTGNEVASLERIIERYKFSAPTGRLDKRERLIKTLSKQRAVRVGKKLSQTEMDEIVQQLFSCNMPTHSPDNEKTMIVLSSNEIERLFH